MSRLPEKNLIFPDFRPFETGHDGYLLLGASCLGQSVLKTPAIV